MRIALEQWKPQIPYQSALLAICAGVAAALVVTVQSITAPIIAYQLEQDQNALLTQILAGQPFVNKVFDEGVTQVYADQTYIIYPVIGESGAVTHHVISGVQEGYSGEIRFLIGVDNDGAIEGVRVVSHSETPGLGDKIEIEKNDWVLGFNQRSLSNTPLWKVKKDGGDFDQFSGATITPRSVVKGVHNALLALDALTKNTSQSTANSGAIHKAVQEAGFQEAGFQEARGQGTQQAGESQ
jgi:electron transport complex protein RnfG